MGPRLTKVGAIRTARDLVESLGGAPLHDCPTL